MAFFDLDHLQEVPLVEGTNVKAVYGTQCSVTFLELHPMSKIPEHHHPNEQIGVVLEGEIEYTINGESQLCRKGSAFLIPPNTLHSGVVVSQRTVKLVDIFAPPRDLNELLNTTQQ